MAGMKSSKMLAWVLNTHGMGQMGGGGGVIKLFNKLIN